MLGRVIALIVASVVASSCTAATVDQSDPRASAPLIIESFPLIDNLAVVEASSPAELPIAVDWRRVKSRTEEVEGARTMLVIRDRSVTDNSFRVRMSVRSAPDGDLQLADLSFFDGPDDAVGTVISSDDLLGHYFLDVTEQICMLAQPERMQTDSTLRIAIMAAGSDVDPERKFLIGRTSLDVVLLD
jgi:hypothetical protein